jgi:ATP-dependent DNA helicase RecG
MQALSLSCTSLKGVGPRIAECLIKCGIYTVQDLLFHLPLRYEDRTQVTPLRQIRLGDHVVVEGKIVTAEVKQGRRKALLCQISDGTNFLTLRFFHFTPKQQQSFVVGKQLRCFGEIRGWSAELEMVHPEYQFINAHTPLPTEKCLTPVYPTTEGLSQRMLRGLTEQALEMGNRAARASKRCPINDEPLPRGRGSDSNSFDLISNNLLPNNFFLNIIDAIKYVHRPPPDAPVDQLIAGIHPAQQRLAFEELLAHHLSLRRLRNRVQHHQAPVFSKQEKLAKQFLAALAFQLTNAQQRVVNEIAEDLKKPQPMMRLVQGDVGSGKTVVAALAALQAIENNYQVALMAPTELLAEQHFRNFSNWLEKLNIKIAWLAGKIKGKARDELLTALANGDVNIIIGTHALFQEDVQFARLGLVIIDEQHRFGVHQRLALREKGKRDGLYPHQLIMTATPIPRTLAMTAYADLDCSVIDELPPGRTPVQTVVIGEKRRTEVIEHVQKACAEKRQVYWVCPLIEESEVLQCQAAETTAQTLIKMLPDLRIALVHGRLTSTQKEQVMTNFKNHQIDLLVATTVIEVGVDVPNASLMVIENAERLGLAQLHQLRGRVGRGSAQSFCVLLYQYPLSNLAKERLKIMRETNDGFAIAQRDLELRGPGEVLGTKQTGIVNLRIADLLRDKNLLSKVQATAEIILRDYPETVEPLIKRWLAQKQHYGGV